ncbi:MAG: hypothetical protein WCO52_05635 [bacterium]
MNTFQKIASYLAGAILFVILAVAVHRANQPTAHPLPYKEWSAAPFERVRTVMDYRGIQMAEVWLQAEPDEHDLLPWFVDTYVLKDRRTYTRTIQQDVVYPDLKHPVELHIWGVHLMRGSKEICFRK